MDPIKSTIDSYIDRTITEIKVELPKPKVEVVKAAPIIDETSLYLKSIVPTTLVAMKKGEGGAQFVQGILTKIQMIIDAKIASISWAKRLAIQAAALVFAPSESEFRKMASASSEFDEYFQKVRTLLDWGFAVGYLDLDPRVTANIAKFDKQKNEYLKQNRQVIKNIIIDRVATFIYG